MKGDMSSRELLLPSSLHFCRMAATMRLAIGVWTILGIACTLAAESKPSMKTRWGSIEEVKQEALAMGLDPDQVEKMAGNVVAAAKAHEDEDEEPKDPKKDFFEGVKELELYDAAHLLYSYVRVLTTDEAFSKIQKKLAKVEEAREQALTKDQRIDALGKTIRSLTADVSQQHGFGRKGFMDGMRAAVIALSKAKKYGHDPSLRMKAEADFEVINTVITGEPDRKHYGRISVLDEMLKGFTSKGADERVEIAKRAIKVLQDLPEGIDAKAYAEALQTLLPADSANPRLEQADAWLVSEILSLRPKLDFKDPKQVLDEEDYANLARMNVLSVFVGDETSKQIMARLPRKGLEL
mmetsp:Transcript_10495/g.23843  ORF Transcript_10495/g.23843 Transcript_10495/m.23843 type:complete len:352 (+) Transcript_10495:112-1167(+)